MRIVIDPCPDLTVLRRACVWINGAVPAQEANVIHHRICAGHPLRGHCTRINAVRVKSDARHDISPALRSFQQRLRASDTLKRGSRISQKYSRYAGVQADEHRVWL